jgi:hypothetical protein
MDGNPKALLLDEMEVQRILDVGNGIIKQIRRTIAENRQNPNRISKIYLGYEHFAQLADYRTICKMLTGIDMKKEDYESFLLDFLENGFEIDIGEGPKIRHVGCQNCFSKNPKNILPLLEEP